jgi:alpha-tubulin suppressor-like RCC1 family protein
LASAVLLQLAACSAEVGGADEAAPGVALGELPLDPVLFPIPFPGPRPPRLNPEEFLDISAGGYHTCARKRSGKIYCWGWDYAGQVGNYPTATCVDSPSNCIDRPTQISSAGGLLTATQLDAGVDHNCALDPYGNAYCWGSSDYGQVGDGDTGYRSIAIAVHGGHTFTSISAGNFNSCGTASDGLYCWGSGLSTNTGTIGHAPLPQLIYASTGWAPIGVSVGYQHVCAQWVSGTYRETNCWGGNLYGQSGSTPSQSTVLGQGPFSVGSAALRVTTQIDYTCVDQPGPNPSVQCFGQNAWGQLGNGQFANSGSAQTVGGQTLSGGPPPLALHGVSTGFAHACALDTNGAAYCWGNGYWGQLGQGASAISAWPVAVAGGLTFRAIAAGSLHTCAIGTDNHIYCWGSNHTGQLGTQYKSPPVAPATSQPYTNGWVSTPVQARDP